MGAGSWGCPHEANNLCAKVNHEPCNPGMKGCELHGRYVFFDDSKNARLHQKKAQAAALTPDNCQAPPDKQK